MNVLLIDDEPLARARLRRLLAELPETAQATVDEAADAAEAWTLLRAQRFDVLLLDIQMPGQSGMDLARRLAADPGMHHPAVVFVTAHEEHALDAFGVAAVDYLTKPVRRDRLAQALGKAALWLRAQGAADPPPREVHTVYLTVFDHGALKRIALSDILYCRAEAKYTSLHTAQRQYWTDTPLVDLEQAYPDYFMRVHRSVLVAAAAIRALERPAGSPPVDGTDADNGDNATWALHLHGVADPLPVSRRRVAAVQAWLRQHSAHP
ncbi:LytTR family DNA-binding domain-containing protein [Thiomonas sp.]|jgi:two-component system response regulator AlgR|uniref:LytR/AlgR family response regulator transcription factor n=1 Tax=Thiomonas sp. TaxID=2047785 RepID=UPI0026377F92|nr:LytTR family DNA-binding domain-containing protein [Thiomonas sp.]